MPSALVEAPSSSCSRSRPVRARRQRREQLRPAAAPPGLPQPCANGGRVLEREDCAHELPAARTVALSRQRLGEREPAIEDEAAGSPALAPLGAGGAPDAIAAVELDLDAEGLGGIDEGEHLVVPAGLYQLAQQRVGEPVPRARRVGQPVEEPRICFGLAEQGVQAAEIVRELAPVAVGYDTFRGLRARSLEECICRWQLACEVRETGPWAVWARASDRVRVGLGWMANPGAVQWSGTAQSGVNP